MAAEGKHFTSCPDCRLRKQRQPSCHSFVLESIKESMFRTLRMWEFLQIIIDINIADNFCAMHRKLSEIAVQPNTTVKKNPEKLLFEFGAKLVQVKKKWKQANNKS